MSIANTPRVYTAEYIGSFERDYPSSAKDEFITLADHQASMKEKDAEIARLNQSLRQLEGNYDHVFECKLAAESRARVAEQSLTEHKELLRQAVNRCADMKEALEFYGDVKNYAVWTSGPLGEEDDSFEFDDGGKRARAVLSKYSKGGCDE